MFLTIKYISTAFTLQKIPYKYRLNLLSRFIMNDTARNQMMSNKSITYVEIINCSYTVRNI